MATLNNNMLMGLTASAEDSHPTKTSTEVLSEKPDCIGTNLDKAKDCTYFFIMLRTSPPCSKSYLQYLLVFDFCAIHVDYYYENGIFFINFSNYFLFLTGPNNQ